MREESRDEERRRMLLNKRRKWQRNGRLHLQAAHGA
jgi:hypothetical protein